MLLGAGASFGYDETLEDVRRPPLTNEVFAKAYRLGTFTEQDFPNLHEKVMSYFQTQLKQTVTEPTGSLDVEQFLGWLADEFEASSKTQSQLMLDINASKEEKQEAFDKAHSFQAALGETWYLLFDTLRTYSVGYVPSFDAYQRLSLSYLREPYSIISLNYDTIFEMALMSSGLDFTYFPPNRPRTVPIAKVHGSINWLNPLARTVVAKGVERKNLFKFVAPLIYSNRFNMNMPQFLDPRSLATITRAHLLRSGTDYDEPILIPPIGNHKDYEKVALYQNIWQQASTMLSQASEFVLIGTTLRTQDAKLCETISKNLMEGTKIVAVRGVRRVTETLNAILPWKPKLAETYESFASYARTL